MAFGKILHRSAWALRNLPLIGLFLALQSAHATQVIAWGLNANGQTNVPVSLTNAVSISAGAYHTVAVRSDGTIVAWGANSNSQTTIPAATASNCVSAVGGGYFTVALKTNGSIAQSSLFGPFTPTNVVELAAGSFHALALLGQRHHDWWRK